PGKVIRSRINCVGVLRVESKRVKVAQIFVAVRSDAFPGVAVVVRTVDTRQGAGHKKFGICRSLRERAHGFFAEADQFPGAAGVVTAIDAATPGVKGPGAGVEAL